MASSDNAASVAVSAAVAPAFLAPDDSPGVGVAVKATAPTFLASGDSPGVRARGGADKAKGGGAGASGTLPLLPHPSLRVPSGCGGRGDQMDARREQVFRTASTVFTLDVGCEDTNAQGRKNTPSPPPPPVNHERPSKCTIKSARSAGVIPLIRPACARLCGCTRHNFSRASTRRCVTAA